MIRKNYRAVTKIIGYISLLLTSGDVSRATFPFFYLLIVYRKDDLLAENLACKPHVRYKLKHQNDKHSSEKFDYSLFITNFNIKTDA